LGRPPLHESGHAFLSGTQVLPIRLLITDLRGEFGAFMEPSGRNQWQPVANRKTPETAESSQNRCHRLRPVAAGPLMVRRGSTVRVRQRALQKRRKSELFYRGRLQELQYGVRV